jgi:hypothetical protein
MRRMRNWKFEITRNPRAHQERHQITESQRRRVAVQFLFLQAARSLDGFAHFDFFTREEFVSGIAIVGRKQAEMTADQYGLQG